jgi:ParB/RepB/Spo0J family partition protein
MANNNDRSTSSDESAVEAPPAKVTLGSLLTPEQASACPDPRVLDAVLTPSEVKKWQQLNSGTTSPATSEADDGEEFQIEMPQARRALELRHSQPGSRPAPDPAAIDPSSSLGQMFSMMNPGSTTDADVAVLQQRLREENDDPSAMPSPSQAYCDRPAREPIPWPARDVRTSYRERLFGRAAEPEVVETRDILLSDIVDCDSVNSSRDANPAKFAALKASMASKTGLINAITVTPDPRHSGKFLNICGGNRVKAARELGQTTIRATIRQVHNECDALLMNLVENAARKDLTSFELAAQVELIVRKFHTTISVTEIAKLLGFSTGHVYTMLRLLSNLPSDILTDWANQHPLLTVKFLEKLHQEPDPSGTWQSVRTKHELRENQLPYNSFVPAEDDGDQSGWEEYKRPSKAKLIRLRDIVVRAKLPVDPEKFRKVIVGLVDWMRGASPNIPYILSPSLKRRPRPRRRKS